MYGSLFLTFTKGFGTGAGLIIAIGAQNAFVLKQGLKRSHVFIVALLCSLIDAGMITLGVNGLGTLVTTHPCLLAIAKYGGAIFLVYYGFKSFYFAIFAKHIMATKDVVDPHSLKTTIITLLAMSFLNPHLYLDTVVLLGTIGAQISEHQRPYFTMGAILASFVWFFALSYGAGYLSPIFQKPLAWKILDSLIGIIMWSIAISLLI